ncbi:non-ribosomal peptide synthetase [Streptomyces sp. NPDC054841]
MNDQPHSPAPLRPLPTAVADIARERPSAPALVHTGQVLSYRDVEERVRTLAAALHRAGVTHGETVAALLPRSAAMATTALATWRAGGIHLPLSPAAPADRTSHMLRTGRARVLVTTPELGPQGSLFGLPTVETDPSGLTVGADPDAALSAPSVPSGPGQPAYIIFTSGTTGQPKGVLVEHAALAHVARAHEDAVYGPLAPWSGRVALNNPATTDAYFSELAHLAQGRTLHVLDSATRRDPDLLAAFLRDHGIEAFDATPTQVRSLLLAGHRGALERLTVLVLGGEPVDEPLWATLRSLRDVAVHNLYGPTECTVDVAGAALHESDTPVIGRGWPGCGIHLLDAARKAVPDGTPGEIWITGRQLARGYLGATPQDEERFTDIEVPGTPGTVRAYRTGDFGRRNRAGLLEFLGRADDQIKIRGYRVELGEVEAALRKCGGVLDAAVALDRTDGGGTLRAWLVLDQETTLDAVRHQLSGLVPEHMTPVLAGVDRIPMAPTGKADVRALSASAAASPEPGSGPVPPREDLSGIWREVLGVDQVSPLDDFFAVGGSSLQATQMTMRVRRATGKQVPIRLVFDHPAFAAYEAAVQAL